jgi:asparagine synthase (glutamine-hydrolysing)
LFNHAVQLQYKKNQENGFPQVATLSGGMDSRSTFLYGLANGYVHQTGYCYGESTSVDYDYAKQLAVKNHCEFFFHSIDNGDLLFERDLICEANEGQMVYSGPSGTYDSLKFYDTSKFGIIHTGLGGGEIMGDMRVEEHPGRVEKFVESLKYRFGKGKKDRSWDSFISSLHCNEDDLKRIEEFKTYYNDFNDFQSLNDIRRCLNSQKIALSFGVEYVSPFLYEDFFCYMLRIPYNLTKGRKLYLYWQKKYNPKQFETPSTHMLGCRPGNVAGYYTKLIWQRLKNRLGKKSKLDMNPYEYWIAHNPEIPKSQESMFKHDMATIENKVPSELINMLSEVWSSNMSHKSNILTATWALRKILGE